MNKATAGIAAALLGIALAVTRTLQYTHEFDAAQNLFARSGPFTTAVYLLCAASAVVFFLLGLLSPKAQPGVLTAPSVITKAGCAILIVCSVLQALWILYRIFNGGFPTYSWLLILFALTLPVYALFVMADLSVGGGRGMAIAPLIPVVTLLLGLIFSFVHITEMSTVPHFVIFILLICSLLLFFFSCGKAHLYGLSFRRCAWFGFLSFIFLCGQTVPTLIVNISAGESALSALSTELLNIGLLVYTYTYSLYLFDH